jgi:branched-chain amino acid transport system ATP-binding protein
MAVAASTPEDTVAVLQIRGLHGGYGDLAAVRDLNLEVRAGEIVALLGPNGAGKTTTLQTIAGVLPPLKGKILWAGEPMAGPMHSRIRRGLGYISEERLITNKLSVKENLTLGRGAVQDAFDLFPDLKQLQNRRAGLLSGGEQQMLIVARCLVAKPSLLLVDELSLGLAPRIVELLLSALRHAAREQGTAILMVEQQIHRALSIADRWYLLRQGSLAATGIADAARAEELSRTYLHGDR